MVAVWVYHVDVVRSTHRACLPDIVNEVVDAAASHLEGARTLDTCAVGRIHQWLWVLRHEVSAWLVGATSVEMRGWHVEEW